MEDVLERRQCKEDRLANDEYLINEEFMAMLDYYVVRAVGEGERGRGLQILLCQAGSIVQGT